MVVVLGKERLNRLESESRLIYYYIRRSRIYVEAVHSCTTAVLWAPKRRFNMINEVVLVIGKSTFPGVRSSTCHVLRTSECVYHVRSFQTFIMHSSDQKEIFNHEGTNTLI